MSSATIWLILTLAFILVMLLNPKTRFYIFTFVAFFTGGAVFNTEDFGIQPIHLIFPVLALSIFTQFLISRQILFSLQGIFLIFFFLTGLYQSLYIGSDVFIGQNLYPLICVVCFYISFYISKSLSYKKFMNFLSYLSISFFMFSIFDTITRGFNIINIGMLINNNNSVDYSPADYTLGFLRSQSIFPEPSYFGAFSAILFVILLGFISFAKSTRIHYWALGAAFISILSTFSLVGILTLLFGILLFTFALWIRDLIFGFFKMSLWRISITFFVLFFAVLAAIIPQTFDFLEWISGRLTFTDTSSIERTGALGAGYGIMINNFLGVGFGNFSSFDLLSTVAATTGFFGFSSLIISFLIPLFCGVKKLYSAKTPNTLSIVLGLMSIFFALSTGIGQYSVVWPWVLFGILSQFAIRQIRRDDDYRN